MMSKQKYSSCEDNHNADFCNLLIELAEYEKNVSRNVHKYNAYRKAASVLASHCKRIESGEDARKLNGIGDKISKKLEEFIQTGKLKKLENINNDEDAQAINQLSKVSGIGPVKAAHLVKCGIKSMDELRKNQDKLNQHQIIGLKYFEDIEKKIPREEIQCIEKKLKKIITSLDSKYTVTICGSYRRGKAESGDIDALVTHPDLKINEFMKKKKSDGKSMLKNLVASLNDLITDIISLGETKFMGLCRLSEDLPFRRLDIRLIPVEQYHCGVLYFTGSDVFNKQMRQRALEMGFTLNEYFLKPIGVTGVPGEPVPVTSEEDIFDYIDFPYKSPQERNL